MNDRLPRRYDAERAEKEECLRLDDIKELLGLPLVGVIPESKAILTATNLGKPVICLEKEDAAQGACVYCLLDGQERGEALPRWACLDCVSSRVALVVFVCLTAYLDLVDRWLGEEKPMRFINPKAGGLLSMLFGKLSA